MDTNKPCYSPVKLAFKVYEPPEKSDLSDIIFIHGILSCGETWIKIGQNIADESKRRVYALDLRNHGDSEWSDEFTWDIMIDDLTKFMDQHSIKSATLIGHSLGGLIAIMLALSQPERVDAIIAEDIATLNLVTEKTRQSLISLIEAMQSSCQSVSPDMEFEKAMHCILTNLAPKIPKELPSPPEYRTKHAEAMETHFVKKDGKIELKMNAEVLKKFIMDKKIKKDLEGVFQKPALFIYGTRSSFKVYEAEECILQHFPQAEFKATEGASHFVHTEYPEEFSKTVLQFLNN